MRVCVCWQLRTLAWVCLLWQPVAQVAQQSLGAPGALDAVYAAVRVAQLDFTALFPPECGLEFHVDAGLSIPAWLARPLHADACVLGASVLVALVFWLCFSFVGMSGPRQLTARPKPSGGGPELSVEAQGALLELVSLGSLSLVEESGAPRTDASRQSHRSPSRSRSPLLGLTSFTAALLLARY